MIDSIKKHRIFLVLSIIILLAGIIRFYKLTEYPVSLYWDEVSIAVNANFIAETGKDEHGKNLPLLFQAFNDYKSPGNIYLTTIPVKIFGLNEFSARFISAFLGTFLVAVMYFLGKNLSILARKNINHEAIGLISAILLATSPWHIQFSRAGFEANSGLFFVTLAITLFIIFLNKKDYKLFFASSLFFAVSCYFYRSTLIFAPLFFIFLILINYKLFMTKGNFLKSLIGILIFLIVLLPFIPQMASREGMSRGNTVSIFNPQNSFDRVVESSHSFEASSKDLISKIIYNRRIVYTSVFIENYTTYFNYNFLFKSGDSIRRHGTIGIGQFYLWQLPFLLIGMIYIFQVRKKAAALLIGWLLLAAIPAALSVPSNHALRSLNMLPAYILIITAGIYYFYKIIPSKLRSLLTILLITIVFASFIQYSALYKKSAVIYSESWADGHKQLFDYIDQNSNKYEKFVITGHFWQPYAYALFYTEYEPDLYLKNGNKRKFDKFIFEGTSWENEEELGPEKLKEYSKNKDSLFALSPDEFKNYQKSLDKLEVIENHNGERVFILSKPK